MAASRIKGITVEINGSVTGLDKALKSANSSISQTQRQLKDVNRLLKIDPGNTELLTQRQRMLAQAIGDTREKLETLRRAAEQANTALANGDITQDQYDALQREIIETEQALERLERQARESASVLGSQMQAAGEKIKEVGDKVTSAGKALMPVTTAIVGVGAAAVKTTAEFDSSMSKVSAISGAVGEDFNRLRTKAREMGRDTKFSAAEAADAMSYMAMAGWDTEDMLNSIDGVMDLAAASGEELASVSDIVTDAMTAFGLAADGTSKVLRDGVTTEVSNATRFVDVLAQASRSSNTNVAMMGETFKYVAPMAGAMGYSIEDTALAIGIMANSGIKGAQAGTSLRSVLTRLASPTEDLASLMEEMGITLDDGNGNMLSLVEVMEQMRGAFGSLKISQEDFNKSMAELDEQLASGKIENAEYEIQMERLMERAYGAEGALKATAAATIAGKYGMSGLIAVANATEEDFVDLKDAIYNASGATEEMADTMQDNLFGQLTILKSQLAEAAIAIGDTLMPAIREITAKVQEWVDKFNGLDESQKRAIVAIGLITAAIGPLLIIIGTLISSVGSIVGAFGSLITFVSSLGALAAPIAAIIAVVVALVAAFVNLWKTNEGFRDSIIAIWDGILAKINEFCQAITERINAFGFEFGNITEALGAAWNGFCELLAPIFEGVFRQISNILSAALDLLIGIFDVFAGLFSGNWDQMLQGIGEVFGAAWDLVVNTFQNYVQVFEGILDTICSFFGTTWADAWEGIQTVVKEKLEAVKETVTGTFENVGEAVASVWESIRTSVGEKINAVKETVANTFENVRETVSSVWETIKNIIQVAILFIGEIISAAFQIITLPWRMLWENTKEYLIDAWEDIKAGVSAGIEYVNEIISNVMGAILETISGAWEKIDTTVSDTLDKIGAVVSEKFETAKETISNIWNAILESISGVWEKISTAVSDALDKIGAAISAGFEIAKKTISNIWNMILESIRSVWERIKTAISEALNKIKAVVVTSFNQVKTTVSNVMGNVKNTMIQKIQGAYNTVSGILGNIKDKFTNIFERVKEIVKNAIEKVKGYFDFQWSLPKLKLPHFSITGEFRLNPPSVPHFSIDWYQKAMNEAYILRGASIFGSMNGKLLGGGEAGSEIVAGTQYMMDLIRDATAQNNQWIAETVGSMENRIADIMSEYLQVAGQAEDEGAEQTILLDPHFQVMIGNRQFDNYIVRTAQKGISGQQEGYRKARGK